MKQSFSDHLLPAVERILETMFFTGVVSAAERMPDECPDVITRGVSFDGPPDGQLRVAVQRQTAAALASSFLGLDPEKVTLANCEQVCAELANMICGSVLSRCAPVGDFHLHASSESAAQTPFDYSVALELPEGGLAISAQVDRS